MCTARPIHYPQKKERSKMIVVSPICDRKEKETKTTASDKSDKGRQKRHKFNSSPGSSPPVLTSGIRIMLGLFLEASSSWLAPDGGVLYIAQ
jgi:hypothetical protein